MICTRCEGTGFLNIHQLPEPLLGDLTDATFQYLQAEIGYKAVGNEGWHELVGKWIENNNDHDVQVCDCCGNGEDWHGEPGEHNRSEFGENGPYAYNGGLPECY